MFKKTMFAFMLLGLTWAGSAQAGFLGNNLELQFLQSLLGTGSVTLSGGLNSNVGNTGINVDVGDTTLGIQVPLSITDPVGLTFTDINNTIPPIIDASGSGNGDVGFDSNSITVTNISSGVDNGVENLTVTIPEPGALDLFGLGLVILTVSYYRRTRARA